VRRALLVLALASIGCATVRPWQRERLARRCMEMDAPGGTASFDAHVRAVRSGDVPAAGAGGGGCGCN
jgi:hypothetical protein